MARDLKDAYVGDRDSIIRERYWLHEDPEGLTPGALYTDKLIRGYVSNLGVMVASSVSSHEAVERILIYLDGVVEEMESSLLEEKDYTTMPFAIRPGFELEFYNDQERVERAEARLKKECDHGETG